MDFLKEFLDEFLRLVGIQFQILRPTREKALLWTSSADFFGIKMLKRWCTCAVRVNAGNSREQIRNINRCRTSFDVVH